MICEHRVGGRKARRAGVLALAAISVVAILLMRKPHVYEFVFFFLGTKYFPEVGYTGLLNDLAAAFDEVHGREWLRARVDKVRDLSEFGAFTPEEAIRAHALGSARWTPARWRDFKEDVSFLEQAMARYSTLPPVEHWRELFKDYGHNFPPAWIAWVHPITRGIALRQETLLALCAIDVGLLAGVFLAVGAAWGLGAAVTALVFVASATDLMAFSSWSLGKFDWLCALAVALLLLARGRVAAAGALWGAAGALRLFPALPAAILAGIWAYRLLKERQGLRAPVLFAGSAAAAFIALNAIATALVAAWSGLPGRELWAQYFDRLHHYQRIDIVNRVGLATLADAVPGTVAPWLGGLAAAALGALLLVALARRPLPPARLGAFVLLFTPLTFSLCHYYYLLLLLPLAAGGRRIAWLTAALMAVNVGVIAARTMGTPLWTVVKWESVAYSLLLAAVPLALFLHGLWNSAAAANDLTAGER